MRRRVWPTSCWLSVRPMLAVSNGKLVALSTPQYRPRALKSRFLPQCLHPAEADMRAFGRDSGFDPERTRGGAPRLKRSSLQSRFWVVGGHIRGRERDAPERALPAQLPCWCQSHPAIPWLVIKVDTRHKRIERVGISLSPARSYDEDFGKTHGGFARAHQG